MDTDEEKLNQLTERVIGCAFKVFNGLACGFLEKVYENALAHELCKAGLMVQQQYPVVVRYDGVIVGDYVADLVVEGVVMLELKACRDPDDIHSAQCLNYLQATNFPVCLLLNFGNSKLQMKRFRGKPKLI